MLSAVAQAGACEAHHDPAHGLGYGLLERLLLVKAHDPCEGALGRAKQGVSDRGVQRLTPEDLAALWPLELTSIDHLDEPLRLITDSHQGKATSLEAKLDTKRPSTTLSLDLH